MTGRVGAVVLAGGRSARFGRDKLVEPIDGRPLLDHAIAAVRAVAADGAVVVVAAPDGEPPVQAGVLVAHDAIADQGPLAGLAAGLAALPDDVEVVLVVGGDMPTLVPAVLERLAAEVARGARAAVLAGDDRPRPLPAAVERAAALGCARDLLAADQRRLRDLMDRLDATVIPAAAWRPLDPDGRTLRDVDVPADLG